MDVNSRAIMITLMPAHEPHMMHMQILRIGLLWITTRPGKWRLKLLQ